MTGPPEDDEPNDNNYTNLQIENLITNLKQKSIRHKEIADFRIEDIYRKARKTLKFAMNPLMLSKQFAKIDA